MNNELETAQGHSRASAWAPSFYVLDALGGFAHLGRRSQTLDGAVPLRVAKACVPLLEGNAFGWQVHIAAPVRFRRRLGLWFRLDDLAQRAWQAKLRSIVPQLVERGMLTAHWAQWLLQRGFDVRPSTGQISLWTGLLVKCRPQVWLRIADAGNRRNLATQLDPQWLHDDQAWIPLVLKIKPSPHAAGEVTLVGEVATIGAFEAGNAIGQGTLAEFPEAGRRHVAFYDAAYFAAKKHEPTRKYRRLLVQEETKPEIQSESPRWVQAGPNSHRLVAHDHALTGEGPRPHLMQERMHEVIYLAPLAFRFCFDGQKVHYRYDETALARAGQAVHAEWARVFGDDFVQQHQGALWYLTKLFTPHPPGEPHFFIKPWAFIMTPEGCSTLIEGMSGSGWSIMRGVIQSHRFFATPAVFHCHQPGRWISVKAGQPLMRLIVFPSALETAPLHLERFEGL